MSGLVKKILVGELLKGQFVKRFTVDVLVAVRDGKAGAWAQRAYNTLAGYKTGIATIGALLTALVSQLADAGYFGEWAPYVVAVFGSLSAGLAIVGVVDDALRRPASPGDFIRTQVEFYREVGYSEDEAIKRAQHDQARKFS